MSVSTTLTLSPVASTDNLQRAQLYQSHHSVGLNIGSSNSSKVNQHHLHHHFYNNNSKNTSSSCYQFPTLDAAVEQFTSIASGYSPLPTEDAQLLERSQSTAAALFSSASASTATATATTLLLQKSSSCNAMLKPKSTILIQDSANGRVNTSLTDSEGDYGATLGGGGGGTGSLANNNSLVSGSVLDICGEQDAFLPPGAGAGEAGANATSNSNNSLASSSRTRGSRSHGKSKASICYRAHAFITRNWYLSYLVPLSILLALMFVAYLTRDYARRLLFWIETQNPWVIFAMFMLFFVVVSFPVVVGYFVLMITSGYLFGFFKGFLTVILGANVGIAIAHVTMRSLRHRIPMHKIIKNETGRAILRVISGPRAFRVVLFTRLTPIPFGIQNAIFGVSSINPRIYHTATFLGLLPAQTINVYLGSTLRSMHEVLNNHGTALTGYISFAVEVVCGVALMFWVVQKARKELSDTLLSDISTEGKLIDIQV